SLQAQGMTAIISLSRVFPLGRANGDYVFVVKEEYRVMWRGCPGRQHAGDIAPIDFHAFGQAEGGHSAEGGHQIDAGDDRAGFAPWLDPAGRPSDERHAIAAVIRCPALAVAQPAAGAFEPGAVIRSKDDDGVLLQMQSPELVQQPPNDRVDLSNDIAVGAGLGAAFELALGVLGQVRGAQRQLYKKRLVAMALDKPLGMGVELLLEHRQIRGLARCFSGPSIGIPDRQWHHVVAVWDAKEHIKAIVGREPVAPLMTEMPFAE